jgi:hypothetical protein
VSLESDLSEGVLWSKQRQVFVRSDTAQEKCSEAP